MDEWDAVVIGGGPAGLSAALWLGRYRRRTLVVDSEQYRNCWVEVSHGYLGSDGVSPMELLDRARGDLKRYTTVERRVGTVESAEGSRDDFVVVVDGERMATRRIVLASGTRDRFPEISNLFDHYGSSVFTCPSCDGYEARGKRVVVIGWSDELVTFSRHLLEWASSVTIVTDGARFEGGPRDRTALTDMGIALLEEDAVEFLGPRGALNGLRFADGSTIDADMGFFSIDARPDHRLVEGLGCDVSDEGCVTVDEHARTSVRGVYAAGDLTPGPHLVQIAAAEGAVAGLSCAYSLRER